ncbi:LysR family transcriptional regulator [Pararhodobacter sp. SW119]|uniref:LysR family transcriptional regulator n=1 Tax=Pararhodobacter sp. SW119 TaxID=2780075 RepID=UPI001AE0CC91|nr:LysR family transcriptional regulator [Pararhodobacter sp. SW119]
MAVDTWDEIRTAWHVARAGTVSGAAEALGVHHATVIRHVDALEARLGVKLFQRHARGYTPTEAGEALAQVGRATDEQFTQLAARLKGLSGGIEGDLIVTTVPELCGVLVEALTPLLREHQALNLRIRTDRRVLRLEYGEAHVALRAGKQPVEPDNVVQLLAQRSVALYAAPAYLAEMGRPETDADLAGHRFVGDDLDDSRAPYFRWLAELGARQIARCNDTAGRLTAMRAGLGLGFLTEGNDAAGLEMVLPSRPEWEVPLWLVTHVDLHRTAKVQAAVSALKRGLGG